MRAGLELWAAHTGAKLVLLDDASDPQQALRLHEELVRSGCRLVLGPYGSDSTRAVALDGWHRAGPAAARLIVRARPQDLLEGRYGLALTCFQGVVEVTC